MSYGLVTDTAAKGVGYRHIKSDWLRWEHRFPAMLEQIKEHGADIVCLQGIDPTNKAFTWVRAMRQLGYEACLQDRQKAGGFYAVVRTVAAALLPGVSLLRVSPGV